MTKCQFGQTCKSNGSGGAVWGTSIKDANITSCLFHGCLALNNGGAVYSAFNNSVFNQCYFQNCNANDGGGIYSEDTSLEVGNTTFSENSAKLGASIYATKCTPSLGGVTCPNDSVYSPNGE